MWESEKWDLVLSGCVLLPVERNHVIFYETISIEFSENNMCELFAYAIHPSQTNVQASVNEW